jgi:hypothetical protein
MTPEDQKLLNELIESVLSGNEDAVAEWWDAVTDIDYSRGIWLLLLANEMAEWATIDQKVVNNKQLRDAKHEINRIKKIAF